MLSGTPCLCRHDVWKLVKVGVGVGAGVRVGVLRCST